MYRRFVAGAFLAIAAAIGAADVASAAVQSPSQQIIHVKTDFALTVYGTTHFFSYDDYTDPYTSCTQWIQDNGSAIYQAGFKDPWCASFPGGYQVNGKNL